MAGALVAMSTGGVVVLVVMNGLWVVLGLLRFIRGWRDPDTKAAMPKQHVLTRRYVDEQFRRPRDESDLL